MDLKEIGFTENESKTYKSLLKIGKSSASEISNASEVPYGRIYNVLDSLERKGLVRTIPEKTKKFSPSEPESLQEYINSKEKIFNELKKKLKEYKEKSKKEINPIEIIKGKKNFYKVLREVPKAKKYEYAIKYNFEVNPEFQREVNKYKKEKVDYRVLGRFDKETEENIKEWKKITKKIKPIKNSGIAMSIIDDKEIILTLIKSNSILIIKDKSFIELLKELFLNYYNNSK